MPLTTEEIIDRLKSVGLTPNDVERVLYGRRWDSYDIEQIARLAAGVSSSEYASKHMRRAKRCSGKHELMRDACNLAPQQGLVAEFGVFEGHTIRSIAEFFKGQMVYGFDSFEGLPESWQHTAKGAFSTNKVLPKVPENVTLVAGWFEDTLPTFVREHKGETFRFIHVDCDLYSSTRTIFDRCQEMIVPGTVIQFDEYYNYPHWQQHEHLAFQEFIAATGLTYRYVGLITYHQQVSVQILG